MDTKTITKYIRDTLKKEYPEWKFSVRSSHFSGGRSIDISIMSGPRSLLASLQTCPSPRDWSYETMEEEYVQLNKFHVREVKIYAPGHELEGKMAYASNGVLLTKEGALLVNRVVEIMDHHNYDNCDSSIDYFDVSYWSHVEIGKWDRPFIVK